MNRVSSFAWVLATYDAWVLQVQHDRFYLNWRQRGATYPRFSDTSGPGVLSRFLREFEGFTRFCAAELGSPVNVLGFELAKIDEFLDGKSWDGFADLSVMLPWLKPFASATESTPPMVGVQSP